MYDLQGKVALVTGAGGEKGIGRAVALRLAREGADVVVNDAVRGGKGDWGGMEAVVAEIRAMGRRAVGLAADVGDSIQVQAMVDQAMAEMGHIDILVNNAGARAGASCAPVLNLEEADWDRVQRVNAKGTFLCCRAVGRTMVARKKGGKIINMSSIAGKTGRANFAAYSASKFAIIGLTECLALELAGAGINVNAVCPGLIATERVDDLAGVMAGVRGISVEEQKKQILAQAAALSPFGRMATVEDVSAVVAFLASSESGYLTGAAVSV